MFIVKQFSPSGVLFATQRLDFIRLLFLFMEHHDYELTNNICLRQVCVEGCLLNVKALLDQH